MQRGCRGDAERRVDRSLRMYVHVHVHAPFASFHHRNRGPRRASSRPPGWGWNHCEHGDGGSCRSARRARARCGKAAAGGAGGPILGRAALQSCYHCGSGVACCATAVASAAQQKPGGTLSDVQSHLSNAARAIASGRLVTQAVTPSPWMLRGGDFGGRPESPTRRMLPAELPQWHGSWRRRAGSPADEWRIGLRRATPAAEPPLWHGSLSIQRVLPLWRCVRERELRERVETRHPPACCLRPRSRHRPAAAKAVFLHSELVLANR